MNRCRTIPAVEKVLHALGPVDLPRALVVATVRAHLAGLRRDGGSAGEEQVIEQLRAQLESLRQTRLQPVINGTGILLHTNLGRAPVCPKAVEDLARLATGYSNLEYDLGPGERGGRAGYVERSLALLCGAEAATVVNNCAAALVLVLRHFTRKKREVIISRGELVQIGGGFRIPDILEASGARLREVGTTNHISLADYAGAVTAETALILKVHRSNFYMAGFVASPPTAQLAGLPRKLRLPLVEDLGSGALVPTEAIPGLEHEPTPAEVLKHGVDLVTFSGDKLLGGPQAGLLAGKARLVASLKRDPFFRALRCDKLILCALQATLELYLDGKAESAIPHLVMLRVSPEELRTRAERILTALKDCPVQGRLGRGNAQFGGGSLPRSTIPSVTLELRPAKLSLAELSAGLRGAVPPVVGYIAGGYFNLNVRTIFPSQDEHVVEALKAALAKPAHRGGDGVVPTSLPLAHGDEAVPAPTAAG